MNRETYMKLEREAMKNSLDYTSFIQELNNKIKRYNEEDNRVMRKLVLCNYFEGLLVKSHCPCCGLENCTSHIKIDDYVQYDALTVEEQREVERLLDRVNGKNWALEVKQCEGGTGCDAYLKYHDVVNGEHKTIYVEICEEPDDKEDIEVSKCKCGGKCKVCKCSLEYKFEGPYVDMLTQDDFDRITMILNEVGIEKGATVELNKTGNLHMFVPLLMAFVGDEVINTGISFEELANRK